MTPSLTHLQRPEVQAAIVKAVEQRQPSPEQMELEGFTEAPDIAAVVAKTSELVIQQTIDIPRILVVPEGQIKTGFRSFTLDLTSLN
jgi:type III restriction enzyme